MDDGGNGCGRGTWPVCSKEKGNTQQGLCDMGGSVWEWILDEYKDSYSGAPKSAEAHVGSAPTCSQRCDNGSPGRVYRGGSWDLDARNLRASNRDADGPSARNDGLGFRPAGPVP